jgi:hypothetical protein
MNKLIYILLFVFPVVLNAQQGSHSNSGNVRKDRPFGISASLGGGNLVGLSMDYFIIPQLDIEAGFGFSQYISVKYHFLGGEEIRWSPYFGLGYGIPVSTIRKADAKYSNGVIGIPVGVKFINEHGFSFSVEVIMGIVHYNEVEYTFNYSSLITKNVKKTELFPSFGISLGYHF